MKRLLFVLFISIAFLQFTIGQTVTGVVTGSDDGGVIPGVNVRLKGSTVGTITNLDGKFSIDVTGENPVLIFSYVGYENKEIAVGNKSSIDITMNVDAKGLDEVVVVGYGTARKSDLSGASVTVSSEKLNTSVTSSIDQALQGHVAGVSVTSTSGAPGSSVSMRIRGTSTLNSDAEPLYVVDGVPIDKGSFNSYELGLGDAVGGGGKSAISPIASLNPSDIESVEVLKDASATAIYGSRGANGVILITTKSGKAGKAKFSYEGYYGIQEVSKMHDMLDLQGYAKYQNAKARAGYQDYNEAFRDPSALGAGSDWQDAIFRVAPMQSHQISASGGTEKSKYAISAGYFNQDGVVESSTFKRFTSRIKLESDLFKWLKIRTTASYSNIDEGLGKWQGEGLISDVVRQAPDIPIKNFDGSWASGVGEYAMVNQLALLDIRTTNLKRHNLTGNLAFDIKPVEWLTFRSEFGGNLGFNHSLNFSPSYNFGPQAQSLINSMSRNRSQSSFYQVNQTITFSKKFDVHSITAMIGHEASEHRWESIGGGARNLPTNSVPSLDLGEATSMTAGSTESSGSLESYFGRLTYGLMDKYNLTATFRRDGSSNFGPNNRWANFPSFAASWRVNKESFMENLAFINNMKLRAGWGITGNQRIAAFSYSVSMTRLPTNLGSGMRPSNYPNPNVRWEESEQLNLGLDMSIFDNLLDLTIDVYQKTSKDMLMEYPFPAYMGGVGNGAFRLRNPVGNFGEISNKGIEVALSAHPFKNNSDFSWDIDAVFSMNENKLVDIGLENATLDGNIQWGTMVSRVENGQAIGSFYGWKVAGIFQDKADILNSPSQYVLDDNDNPVLDRNNTVWVGDIKYEDVNGDNVIDEKDRTYLGSPQPKFSASLRNSFSYKGFDLTVFITAKYGHKLYNYVRQGRDGLNGMDDMQGFNRNQLATVLNHADFEPIDPTVVYPDDEDGVAFMDDIDNVRLSNPGTNMPRITDNDPNNNIRVSDRYIEDASYLRISNITLGYNFPSSWMKKVKVSNLRVYASVQNVFTFTEYTGLDPEVGQDVMVSHLYGVDNHRYPSPRIYTFGLNLNF